MTDDEMIDFTNQLAADERIEGLSEDVYLPMAKSAVISRLFPFEADAKWEDVPARFHEATCLIAVYLYSRAGAEGETRHVENGTTHEWDSAGIPKSYFDGMTPMAGAVR